MEEAKPSSLKNKQAAIAITIVAILVAAVFWFF
jgi:hypothetical protein